LEGLKEHKCECCGIIEWNGKPAPIELDHINGNRRDNSLDNLRVLCPNCHAQTDTYRGKNKKCASGQNPNCPT
jgi:heterodisulfide reductase subunit B